MAHYDKLYVLDTIGFRQNTCCVHQFHADFFKSSDTFLQGTDKIADDFVPNLAISLEYSPGTLAVEVKATSLILTKLSCVVYGIFGIIKHNSV